jgi:predicted PurR-regulated permease PerM
MYVTLLDRRTASSLLTFLVFAIVAGIAYVARTVIVIFAFAILCAYLINPVVRFLQRHSLFFKNLRGPHVLEAYLAFIFLIVLTVHGLVPELHKNPGQFVSQVSTLTGRISSGEIADDLGGSFGWSDAQALRVKGFLQQHHGSIENTVQEMERFGSTAIAGILVIPILAIFFLSDGDKLADHVVHLISTRDNYESMRALADELNVMMQHYIRAKVILGLLSLTFCTATMLALGYGSAVTLGVLAGMLEFIPVAGWMIAAATIVTAGILGHSHWIWMLVLLCVWRILMDYAISPRVMGHELEIHPLLAIFTVMVGGAVGGIVGIYLSIPLVAALRVVYRSLWMQKSRNVEILGKEEAASPALVNASGSALS